MNQLDHQFYANVLTAGSIIAGFCGLFLLFRIEREAAYRRSPGREAYSQHFTSSMLIIILSTACSFIFGVWIPLLGLAGLQGFPISPALIVGGLIGASLLLATYVLDEMIHYEILYPTRPASSNSFVKIDSFGFRRERWVWISGIVAAFLFGLASWWFVSRSYVTSSAPPRATTTPTPRATNAGES